jgi:hypothetical protein
MFMGTKKFIFLGEFRGVPFIILATDLDHQDCTDILKEILGDRVAIASLARFFPFSTLDDYAFVELGLNTAKFLVFFQQTIKDMALYKWERATNRIQLLTGN